jgi:hypothetical protein
VQMVVVQAGQHGTTPGIEAPLTRSRGEGSELGDTAVLDAQVDLTMTPAWRHCRGIDFRPGDQHGPFRERSTDSRSWPEAATLARIGLGL